MASVEETIEVEVPVRTAYEHWTRFEDFPEFMDGVKDVEEVAEGRTRWTAATAGQRRQWEAEVTTEQQDERIEWQAVEGAEHAGVVTFEAVDEGRTRLTLRLEFEPEGAIETAAEKAGLVDRQVRADLERFKKLVESGPQ